jgi:hypothetical protein
VDVDDAFGGFDSVVLGNLLHKNEVRTLRARRSCSRTHTSSQMCQVALKKVARMNSSDKLNKEDVEDVDSNSSSDEKA